MAVDLGLLPSFKVETTKKPGTDPPHSRTFCLSVLLSPPPTPFFSLVVSVILALSFSLSLSHSCVCALSPFLALFLFLSLSPSLSF